MNQPIRRHTHGEGFGPAHLKDTIDVPIAVDNLVCGVCQRALGGVSWCIVSGPKRKGIAVFACEQCIGPAMNMLTLITPELNKVPNDLKLPDAGSN
jgi:hypothetical protein